MNKIKDVLKYIIVQINNYFFSFMSISYTQIKIATASFLCFKCQCEDIIINCEYFLDYEITASNHIT